MGIMGTQGGGGGGGGSIIPSPFGNTFNPNFRPTDQNPYGIPNQQPVSSSPTNSPNLTPASARPPRPAPLAPSNDPADQALANILAYDQANADSLQGQAKDFRSNMPSYIGNQVDAATGQSRLNLANDIQGVKTNSNARGLLYSGINSGNQAAAAGYESAGLAQNIQDINNKAGATLDYKQQVADAAQQGVDTESVQYAQLLATKQQTAYQQALQEQQNQNQFYGQLIQGGVELGAIALLALL